MSSNVVVKTVNQVVYETNESSYQKALGKIKSLKKEMEKSTGAFKKTQFNPAPTFITAAKQMALVNKRLEETRRKETKRTTDYNVAMAKKEARAQEAIRKQSAARIRQTMKGMTASNPEMAKMRQFYMQQEKAAKAAGRKVTAPEWTSPAKAGRLERLQARLAEQAAARGGAGSNKGMAVDDATAARAQSQLGGKHKPGFSTGPTGPSPEEIRARAAKARIEAQRAAAQAKRDETIGLTSMRMSGKYGAGFGNKAAFRGVEMLNRQFREGAISAARYRASIAQLESQFRSANRGAMTFSQGMGQLRGMMFGAGAGYGLFAGGKSILDQGQFFQGLDATMLMVSDSSKEASDRIQFVREQSYRLGLDLKKASQGYTQMSIAADGVITKDQNNELFKSFSEYSTALQVDPVRFQRGITAIQQMMGKGQIMAEELKQQLAEGIPGSLQVFLKATREAFGKETIQIDDMMDMMQKGELKAAKIMPFVAKYYTEAARKGGALDKALNGNRVAMQRLSLTWIDFQDKVFKGGFGEKMTDTFNSLAKALSSNGSLATNIGSFFGGIVEGATDMFEGIYNAFLMVELTIEHFAKKFGMEDSIKIGDMLDWAGWAVGVLLFTATLGKLYGMLFKIVGLAAGLKTVKDLATGGWGKAGGDKAGKGGGAAKSGRGILGKLGRLAGPLAVAGWVMDIDDRRSEVADKLKEGVPLATQGDTMMDDLMDWVNGGLMKSAAGQFINPTSGISPPGATAPITIAPFMPAPQEINGKIEININAGELQKMIETAIEDSDMQNLNMLLSATGGV